MRLVNSIHRIPLQQFCYLRLSFMNEFPEGPYQLLVLVDRNPIVNHKVANFLSLGIWQWRQTMAKCHITVSCLGLLPACPGHVTRQTRLTSPSREAAPFRHHGLETFTGVDDAV